ncbi:MAG: lipoprotein [Pseudohongiellaceae bacterium]
MALLNFSLCFCLRWRYNRDFPAIQTSIRTMNNQTNRLLALLALTCLTLSLSTCGQKGGLTRPEQSAFTTSNFVSGK